MSTPESPPENMFLVGSLPKLFLKTAAPIILVMLVSGFFTVVDAYFLGEFVGPEALTAVTMMFPVFMLIVALSTWVSGGFSSVVARLLGARKNDEANAALGSAILLSAVVCLLLIALFLIAGTALISWVTKGSLPLSEMGYSYISLLIFFSPLQFLLTINFDALRCEGKMGFIAFLSLFSTLLNITFNYILIVKLEQGVAGSAYGTILAQLISIIAVGLYHQKARSAFTFSQTVFHNPTRFWKRFLALGAPASLGYLGVSMTSATILYSLQQWGHEHYAATVAAYGIITRIMTFTFLPLLGLNIAFQTVAGNNQGAQLWPRVNASIKLALLSALFYCGSLQILFNVFAGQIGFIFVDDSLIASETQRILPQITLFYFAFGLSMVLSGFFQAIGDARRSAILGLSRTYLFSLPLIFTLPFLLGEQGIWYAPPLAEFLMIILSLVVLFLNANTNGMKMGLFRQTISKQYKAT
ncbi:MATE family efflux transporter [Kiloniella laminariae]|uniref:Multidrug export protein MepA n=1 Tax=Kiloniella laminariae TaxID=454162 RepID=A0ABT4LEC4_9PROT|nr:MATE family efflux transporter [Kiloniella laminariae]MCZ4279443.1 MATE family efflux transporter [Kiloniella laminariae]